MKSGYDPGFLGLQVPLPTVPSPIPTTQLPYSHFTVVLRLDRRLAAVSAVNIHGALLKAVPRTMDPWRIDPRVGDGAQATNSIYVGNDFDRGHLTRREDPCWGTQAEAEEANSDTFYFTNAAPQVATFNQSKSLWRGLEDYVIEHAEKYEQRLNVFTGPILDESDPLYRGLRVPLQFYKIIAWVGEGGLSATGYILDQSELVEQLLSGPSVQASPLGKYRTYQVPVELIAGRTELHLPELVDADVLTLPEDALPGTMSRELTLTRLEDVQLLPGPTAG
ncbi:DNA/RNA non-specific endonuclease [Nakamurella silvestris]|nr:DNA/RNA non-specific endonuclease [Nakamurella silvestris]